MTVAELQALVSRVRVRGIYAGAQVAAVADHNQVSLRVTLTVPDVETGTPINLQATDAITRPLLLVWRRNDVMERVRELLRTLAAHEVDEGLLLDGEAVFDPHRPPRRVCSGCGRYGHNARTCQEEVAA